MTAPVIQNDEAPTIVKPGSTGNTSGFKVNPQVAAQDHNIKGM
jgi:hypothetical protein